MISSVLTLLGPFADLAPYLVISCVRAPPVGHETVPFCSCLIFTGLDTKGHSRQHAAASEDLEDQRSSLVGT